MPSVIDGLCTLIRGLGLKVNGNDTLDVFDGLPTDEPETYVMVGGSGNPVSTGKQSWASLGASNGGIPASRDEEYDVELTIVSWVGGSDDANAPSSSDAQRSARQNVFTIAAQIETGLRNDPSIGGTVYSSAAGDGTGWASWGTDVRLDETNDGDDDAGMGRKAVLTVHIGVFKRLYSA